MLFRVCEHYDDNYPIILSGEYDDNDCFICFERMSANRQRSISLISQPFYIRDCICNGAVHCECLKIWYDINKSCPICRKKMVENTQTSIVFYTYIPFGINIYLGLRRFTCNTLKLLSVLLFIYSTFDMYFMIIRTRNKNMYEDYSYNQYQITNITSVD